LVVGPGGRHSTIHSRQIGQMSGGQLREAHRQVSSLTASNFGQEVGGLSTRGADLDVIALGRWMDEQDLPGKGAELNWDMVVGGTQNEIFDVRRGDFRCALRRPPKNAPEGRGSGILREWRIVAALDGTEVPHAEGIAVCRDPSVIGMPFYLMQFIDGWSPIVTRGWIPPFDQNLDARRGIAYEVVRGIAKLSRIDWRQRGLEDLGRPEGFHERQVDRWMAFLEPVRTRPLPGLSEATEWLRARRPRDFIPGLMHGDYQFANVILGNDLPPTLAAIVDWEMGTIGDPKLDLCWLLQDWPEGEGQPFSSRGYIDLSDMPNVAEMADFYSSESGRQVDDLDYYLVLARWKYAIVLEQGYARAIRGQQESESLLGFGAGVLNLMARAAELAESSTYR
jgi:aminoglycoside phosphotransferase (APT) family kinase protein